MTIINIIFYAVLWRICGGGIVQLSRWIPLLLGGLFLAVQLDSVIDFLAFGWLFFVIRIIPTNGLLSAIHDEAPLRPDGRWDFLRHITRQIWLLPIHLNGWAWYGVIYGVVRASLAIPAMIYLGGLAWLFLAQGVIYYVAGRINKRFLQPHDLSVGIAECICGGIFGALI